MTYFVGSEYSPDVVEKCGVHRDSGEMLLAIIDDGDSRPWVIFTNTRRKSSLVELVISPKRIIWSSAPKESCDVQLDVRFRFHANVCLAGKCAKR